MGKVYRYLGVYAAFLLQTLIVEKFHIMSATPNLFLAAVMLSAAFSGPWEAAIRGGLAGAFSDALLKPFFGGDTLLFMYAAIAASVFIPKRSTNSPLIMGWYGFVCMAFFYVLGAAARICARAQWSAARTGANILVSGILSAVLFFAVTLILYLKSRGAEHTEGEVSRV